MNEIVEVEALEKPSYCMKYETASSKIISNIEKLVRISYHYKIFIFYLKNTLDMNECAFYEGFSVANGLSVEIHHSPITLFEYTMAVANKHIEEKGYFRIMEVASEVTKLHYQFLVGLVPLNNTAHKLVHNQQLSIHPDLVIGDWNEFYVQYQGYGTEALKSIIDDATFAQNNMKMGAYPSILRRSETIFKQQNVKSLKDVNVGKMITDIKLRSMNLLDEKK
ncbi:MAG: hypothetical protein ACRC5M_04420 [Anaeroplasmataceae bacterium]